MDLEEMLHMHQVAVMKAAAAGDTEGQSDHFAKVAEYAARIRAMRGRVPANDVGKAPQVHDAQAPMLTPENGPPAIIYGTDANATGRRPAAQQVDSWEDEGGAVRNREYSLPEGIETRTVREYRVGPYVYHDLDLAVAEHLRQLRAADTGPA